MLKNEFKKLGKILKVLSKVDNVIKEDNLFENVEFEIDFNIDNIYEKIKGLNENRMSFKEKL